MEQYFCTINKRLKRIENMVNCGLNELEIVCFYI